MTNFTDTLRISPMSLEFRHKHFSTTDAEFFFINTAYLDAYIQLLDGIRQQRGLLILTGEAGIGKTLLLRKLINESPVNIKFAFCYSTHLDFNNLLAVIFDQLAIKIQEDTFNRLEILKHHLNSFFMQGIDVALLIDDAHHLNEEALNGLFTLSRLEFQAGRTLQIVLSGIPMLEEILARMQNFHPCLANAIHIRLRPLTTVDVAAFISRQVQNADGPAIDSLFPFPVIERINNYTEGIPRLINLLCERALLITQMKGQTTVSMTAVDEAASELMLKNRETASLTDFFPSETTRSGSPAQVAMMERLLAQSEELSGEETQSLVVRPPSIEKSDSHSSSMIRREGHRPEKKHFRLFDFTGLQLALFALLALLAGLVGGTGSIYLYQRITAEVKPSMPAPADRVVLAPAPASQIESPTSATTPEKLTNPEAGSSATGLESSQQSLATTEVAAGSTARIELPSASPSSTAVKAVDASLVTFYLTNGNVLLSQGDVASARLFYQEAANAGSMEAMVAVGKTYDPVILNQLGIRGFRPNPVKAAEWYLKAREIAGDLESAERIEALKHWLANDPALGEAEANTLRQMLH